MMLLAATMPAASARCEVCNAELSDTAERFCGGDRCVRVFWNRAWSIGSTSGVFGVQLVSAKRSRGVTAAYAAALGTIATK